jgi:hypothetical protein
VASPFARDFQSAKSWGLCLRGKTRNSLEVEPVKEQKEPLGRDWPDLEEGLGVGQEEGSLSEEESSANEQGRSEGGGLGPEGLRESESAAEAANWAVVEQLRARVVGPEAAILHFGMFVAHLAGEDP